MKTYPTLEEAIRAVGANEPWFEWKQNSANMTANVATELLTKEGRKDTVYVVDTIGTNGGTNIKLEIKNKGDLIGDPFYGVQAPFAPVAERYKVRPVIIVEEGDYLRLYGTAAAAAGTSKTKFDIRGFKNERLGGRVSPM